VSVLQHSLPEASAFIIELGLLDGHGPDECVRYLDAELAPIAHDGPSEDELASAKATLLAGVASSRDGSANRAKTLQSNLSEAHDPARFVGYAASYSALRPSQIAQAAAEWLVSDRRVLLVLQRRGTPAAASRSKKNGSQPQRPAAVNDARWLAPPTSVAAVPFVDPPDRYDAPLPVELVSAEGYRIQLIERHTVPIVRVSAVIRWEQPFPNIASRGLRERLLVAAHAPRSELGLQDSLRDAGATLSWDDKLETTTLSLLAYPDRMAAALEALMAVLRARRVPVEELNRLRPVGWLERQTLSPSTMANVWARHLLAPPKHRYSIALDGGLAELQAMGVSDFERYFDQSMQPSAVTIDVVGDVSEARLAKLLRASPAKPRAARPTTSFAWATGTFLVDQKGAKGVDVVVALPHPMRDDPDAAAAAVVEAGFFDRLNDAFNAHGIDSWSNRTEKLWELRDGSLDYFTVHVEKDKLLPLVGLLVERCALVLDRAYMATHLARVGASEVFAPLLRDDSTKNILGSLNELAAIDVSPRSALDYERRLRAVTMEQVLEAAKKYFKPFAMRIVAFGEVGGIVNQLGRLPIAPVKTLSDDAHRVAR
jgi:predicted Zn-dependent peptidase